MKSISANRAGIRFGFYDWAASPLAAIHATFIFPVYFATQVMPHGGDAAWALMTALAAIITAIAAPFTGAIADRFACRKTMLAGFTAIACIGVSSLWFIAPDMNLAAPALIISAIIIIVSELALVVYNALIKQAAGADTIGRVSGLAWGIGYFGAILCLMLLLVIFYFPAAPPFGLDVAAREHIRIMMPLAGIWLAIFAIPFFFMTREGGRSSKPFLATFKEGWEVVRRTKGLLRFLVARIFFTDALITLFAMGGIFAAAVHGFGDRDVLVFGLILNITAGIGAVAGGFADDRFGSLATIRFALIAMMAVGVGVIATGNTMLFWGLGSVLGLFVGPLQAAARSHVARLSPPGTEARVFGFMIFTGKATAFLGPLLYGVMLTTTDSHRLGMGVVMILFLIGLVILPRK